MVGYWPDPASAPGLDADVIIGTDQVASLLPRGENDQPLYIPTSFGLRPGYVLWIYAKRPLWEKLQEYWASKPVAPRSTRANKR
jgi:hypothetical protein